MQEALKVLSKPSTSTPAAQLAALDSVCALASESAEAAAKRLLEADAASDEDRIRLAYRQTLCREPRPDEMQLSLEFLRREGVSAESSNPAGWTALMRTLFRSDGLTG